MQVPKYDSELSYIKAMPQPITVGPAVAGLGKVLTDIGAHFVQKLRENREATQFAKAQTDTINAFNKFRLDLEKDPEYLKYPEKYEEFKHAEYDSILRSISEPGAQEAFQMWVERESTKQQHDVDWLSHNKEVKDQLQSYDNDIQEAIKRGDHPFVIARTNAAIRGGLLLESQGQAVIDKSKHQIDYNNAYNKSMALPILEAEAWIQNSENTPDLTPDERERLLKDRRYEDGYQKARAREEHEKVYNQAWTDCVKDFDSLSLTKNKIYQRFDPQQDASAIDHWINLLNRRAEAARKKKADPFKKSDPMVYAAIAKVVYDPYREWDEKRQIVNKYHGQGLSTADYIKFMNELDTKRGKGNFALDTGFKLFDKAFKDGKIKSEKELALRKNDYMDRLRNDPQLSDEEKIRVAQNQVETIQKNNGLLGTGLFGESNIDFVNKIMKEGKLLGAEDNPEYKKAIMAAEAERAQKFEDFLYRKIESDLGYEHLDVFHTVPSSLEASPDLEKIKEELENYKVDRQFDYPGGDPGYEVLNSKTGEKQYYIWKDGEWKRWHKPVMQEDKATIISDADRFKKQFGGWDSLAQTDDGTILYVKDNKTYRYKNGKLQVYVGATGQWVTATSY